MSRKLMRKCGEQSPKRCFGRTYLAIISGLLLIGAAVITGLTMMSSTGCGKQGRVPLVVYCGVDEPYASKVFEAFTNQTGILVAPEYDIESSKSVGLASKLEAEKDHPRADVWWSSEQFLSGRLANAGVLAKYQPPSANDIPAQYKDPNGYWTGVGLRARVLAVSNSMPADIKISSIWDLANPRLKNKIAISRPTAGATVAHVSALYAYWGQDKARDLFHKLYDNQIHLLGGNAEVAIEVGNGNFLLGLTDTDDIADAQSNGGQLHMIVPDQGADQDGTLAMPSTIALVKGSRHAADAKKLLDFLAGPQTEKMLIDLHYAHWSVRGKGQDQLKAMQVDYAKAVLLGPRAQQEATDILDTGNLVKH